MKILSPVDKVEEVRPLVQAGADELYCGVLDEDWMQRYPIAAVNRRIAKACNFKSFADLEACLEVAHAYNIPVSLTINEHYYTQEQYPLLTAYIFRAAAAGVDSFLISDIALLLHLQEMGLGIPVHISTGGTTFNSRTAQFYKGLGASRITIPRHVTINEIRDIATRSDGIETCVFVLNSRCSNVDGFCTFLHVQSPDPAYRNACMLDYDITVIAAGSENQEPVTENWRQNNESRRYRQQAWNRHHMDEIPCGACALYDFEQIKIDFVKIVGRGNQTWRKVLDVQFIRQLLSLLNDGNIGRDEFYHRTQTIRGSVYRQSCQAVTCYYPEVLCNPSK